MKRVLVLWILLATFPLSAWAASPSPKSRDTIGIVKNSGGTVTIQRGKTVFPAVAGMKLAVGDVLSTGSEGSVGVILRDNSSLSLGPRSSIALQEFEFSPAEGKMSFIARLAKGTMAYMSGIIGKLSPESVRFDTPVASIGIRGTCFVVDAGDGLPE
jgi:hypothetical protein